MDSRMRLAGWARREEGDPHGTAETAYCGAAQQTACVSGRSQGVLEAHPRRANDRVQPLRAAVSVHTNRALPSLRLACGDLVSQSVS